MSENPKEARRHRRVSMLGTAILRRENEPGHVVAIDNLSAGGLLVSSGVEIEPGTWVHVLLCLPGTPAASLLARVVRRDRQEGEGWRLALEFDRVAPHVAKGLHDRVEQVFERQVAAGPGRALVVGPDNDDRSAMTTELKAMGFVVLAVDSVNEAAEYLGPQPPPFELVAVDAVSECAEGVDLLAMAHRIYPNMHCVLVGDAVDSEHLVREHSFLKRGELLLRPWSAQDLRRAATASTG